MHTASYLRGLLRSWWLVLVATVAGVVGGFLVYTQTTPLYASSVTVVVASDSPKADEASARALTELRAETIQSVAGTGPVLEAAIEASGRDDAGGTAASATVSGSFVTVEVTGPSPEAVRDVATAYPDVMPEQTDELVGPSGTPFSLNIVSPAGLPTEPFRPVLSTDLGLGLAAGLVLGLALAVLRETLNRTLRTSEELRDLTGLTVLGTVPRDLPKQALPASTHPRSARAEAYRQVRTTIVSSTERRPLVIAVTSATVGEGKTSVSSNLAVALSRAGHRVALIDADLRRPKVADFFGVDGGHGLTDLLTGERTLDEVIVQRDEGRLGVVVAGGVPANPSEALGSAAMGEILLELSDRYEFVVIDTPPVLPVTDALVLAPRVDGIVLVSRLGYTTRERVERAMAAVERVNATFIGVVPNQAAKGSDADYSYTYRSRQDPRGSEADPSSTEIPPSPDGAEASSRPTVPVGRRIADRGDRRATRRAGSD